jgi:hypothetical protein
LEELSLPSAYQIVPVDVITSFVKISGCSLRSFSMTLNVSAYYEGLMSFLPLIPSPKT